MKLIGPDGPLDAKAKRGTLAPYYVHEHPNSMALWSKFDTAFEALGELYFHGEGESGIMNYAIDGPAVWVNFCGVSARFALPDGAGVDTEHEARAPMTGKVVSIPVKVGDTVKRGDDLAVLEAMKMESRLEAEADGVVAELGAKEGELVDLGQLLVRLE